jgi:hypothetical protein
MSGRVPDLFDQDMLGRTIAEGDARTANLTKERVGSGNFFDDGGLAKSHFAEPLTDLGFTFELLHPTSGTDRKFG